MSVYREVQEQLVDGEGYLVLEWNPNGFGATPIRDIKQLEAYMKEFYFEDEDPDCPVVWHETLPSVYEGQLESPDTGHERRNVWVIKAKVVNPKPVEVVTQYQFSNE